MKYVQISHSSGGWAVEIVFGKHRELTEKDIDSYVLWGFGKPTQNDHEIKFCNEIERMIDKIQTRIDGRIGFHSKKNTKKLIKILDSIQPDIVHLHSPLGYYLNIEIFFQWLKKSNCKFYWTMHDCWAFTGYCMHFTIANCSQWKTGCTQECPCPPRGQKIPDFGLKRRVAWNYKRKKEIFTSLPVDRVTLIAPSEWLAGLLKESFLGIYNIEVRHNKINLDVFKPTSSDIRRKLGINDRFVILGVSSHWGYRKGIQDFNRLFNDLDNSYAVVLVGLSEKQIKELEKANKGLVKFVGLQRTTSREELASIYTMANVFFNPTLEDNYPTVNLEAEACGTPVITYDIGGCRETIHHKNSITVTGYEEALKAIQDASKFEKSKCEG